MKQINLAEDRIPRLFAKFSVPFFFSSLGTGLLWMGNGVIMGQILGGAGLAATNLGLPFEDAVWALELLIAVGGASLMGIALGAGDRKRAREIFTLCALCLVGVATLAAAAVLFFGRQLAVLLGAEGELIGLVQTYLLPLGMFTFVSSSNILLSRGVTLMGKPRRAMVGSMLSAVVTLMANYLFVAVLGFGVAGEACATAAGTAVSCVILLPPYLKKGAVLGFTRLRVRLRDIGRIFSVGAPESINMVSAAVTVLLFNTIAMRRMGEDGVTAYSVLLYVHELVMAGIYAVSESVIPINSFQVGARRYDRSRRFARLAAGTVAAVGVASGLLLFLGRSLLADIFCPGDPALQQLTETAFSLYALGYLFMGFNMVVANYFISMAKPWAATAIDLCRSLVMTCLALAALPGLLGDAGVWLAVPAAEAVTVALSAVLLLRTLRRQPKAPVGLDNLAAAE